MSPNHSGVIIWVAKVSPPPRAKAQTGALRAKTAILLTWTMDLRPRSSPTFSRAGPQWRPFGQAAGRPALSDAGAAADSGKNSSSQLRASRFVVLSLEAFYDSSYTSSDGKPGIFGSYYTGCAGKVKSCPPHQSALRLTASPHRGRLFLWGKSPGGCPGAFMHCPICRSGWRVFHMPPV